MSENGEKRYVTNAELKSELDKLPTRWEMRFMIAAAIVVARVLPATDIAHAAVRAVH